MNTGPQHLHTIVFVHAHPDDEAIFTGGTMALLAAAGHRVVLVVATSGELGIASDAGPLRGTRQAETRRACAALGIDDVRMLGRQDSGLHGENPDGFVHGSARDDANALVSLLDDLEPIDALVSYDDHGIYGHPDHVHVHDVVNLAAPLLNVETVYESTVDREYLHFVETHLVVDAGLGGRPVGRGLAATELGLPSLLVDTTVDVESVLDVKLAAMAAHASQLPPQAPVFALGPANFAAVYRYEWYRRVGQVGVIDSLPTI